MLMFSCVKQKLCSFFNALKAPYMNFTKAKRETTSKTFQSLAVTSVAGGLLKILIDGDASNNWEIVIWLPCAIMFYHFSIMVLPGEDE